METLADRIRRMTDEELGSFLFVHQVNALSSFFQKGGAGCRNAVQMKQYVKEPAPDDKELLCIESDEK